MCLIVFDWQPDATRALTLASNRDEFYDRPSLDAHFWEDAPNIFGGRDLKMNGTWLAVSKNMRLAAITNFRSPDNKDYPRSRGEIPSLFLNSTLSATDYAKQLSEQEYAGYNALLFDGQTLVYCHNQFSGKAGSSVQENDEEPYRVLPAGKYGLSNHLLDTPWPKVTNTKKALHKVTPTTDRQEVTSTLLEALNNQQIAPEAQLPDTGIEKSIERLLSPAFIASPNYGTRTSTVIFMEKSSENTANFVIHERQYQGQVTQFRDKEFVIHSTLLTSI